jgi:hypothetical protein
MGIHGLREGGRRGIGIVHGGNEPCGGGAGGASDTRGGAAWARGGRGKLRGRALPSGLPLVRLLCALENWRRLCAFTAIRFATAGRLWLGSPMCWAVRGAVDFTAPAFPRFSCRPWIPILGYSRFPPAGSRPGSITGDGIRAREGGDYGCCKHVPDAFPTRSLCSSTIPFIVG